MPDSKFASYLDELVNDLRAKVPRAIAANDVGAVHDARVATRRLKSALDLLEPVLDRKCVKPFARTLRRLRRKLGPLRDLDVMADHLRELREHADAERSGAVQWVEARLGEARLDAIAAAQRGGRGKVLGKLGAWWGVRDQIDEAEEALDTLLRDSLTRQFADFARAADMLAAVPSDAPPAAEDRVDPHAIRIAGKRLRYTLEMAEVQGHAPAKSVARVFKKMQDALGLWHDFIVLTERMLCLSGDAQIAHHDAAAQCAILGLSQATLRRAEKQLDKFAELWKQRGGELTAAVRAICTSPHAVPSIPMAAPAVTESQTGRDPSSSTGTAVPEESRPDAPEAA